METTRLCLCVLILSGAVACIALAVLLFSLLSTIKNLNQVISSLDVTVTDVNDIVEDVKVKMKKLDMPIDATKGTLNDGIIKTGLSTALGLTSFAFKKFTKKGK